MKTRGMTENFVYLHKTYVNKLFCNVQYAVKDCRRSNGSADVSR